MKANTRTVQPGGATLIELEIAIAAPQQDVWNTLVNRAGEWWHKDFYATQNPKSFVIEPKLGGRFYEDCGNGNGFIWYTILGIEPPNSILAIGHTRPPFGGPCTSFLKLELESKGPNETVLTISDAVHGFVSDALSSELDAGWRMLFGALKRLAVSQ